jgi:hypothetical protein
MNRKKNHTNLRPPDLDLICVVDMDPGSGFGIRHEKKIKIRIRYKHPGSYFRELKNYVLGKTSSVADPDPGSGIRGLFDPWIRDGFFSGSRILNPYF